MLIICGESVMIVRPVSVVEQCIDVCMLMRLFSVVCLQFAQKCCFHLSNLDGHSASFFLQLRISMFGLNKFFGNIVVLY